MNVQNMINIKSITMNVQIMMIVRYRHDCPRADFAKFQFDFRGKKIRENFLRIDTATRPRKLTTVHNPPHMSFEEDHDIKLSHIAGIIYGPGIATLSPRPLALLLRSPASYLLGSRNSNCRPT